MLLYLCTNMIIVWAAQSIIKFQHKINILHVSLSEEKTAKIVNKLVSIIRRLKTSILDVIIYRQSLNSGYQKISLESVSVIVSVCMHVLRKPIADWYHFGTLETLVVEVGGEKVVPICRVLVSCVSGRRDLVSLPGNCGLTQLCCYFLRCCTLAIFIFNSTLHSFMDLCNYKY